MMHWKILTAIIVITVAVITIILAITLNKTVVEPKPQPLNIPIGKAIQCSANPLTTEPNDILRYIGNNKVMRYPSPAVAGYVDPNWTTATKMDCKGLTRANDVLGGTEYSTAVFQCPVVTGTVIYGTQPNKIITVPIKPGTKSMQMSNPSFGTDPNPGILKNWGAYYTC